MRYEKKGAPLAEQEKEQYLQQGDQSNCGRTAGGKGGLGLKRQMSFWRRDGRRLRPFFVFQYGEGLRENPAGSAEKEQVAVYSDYDCDGVCGAAILQKHSKHWALRRNCIFQIAKQRDMEQMLPLLSG